MISLKIVTVEGIYRQMNVQSIHLTSVEGEMTILPNHIPIFAQIVPCRLRMIDEENKVHEYAMAHGFCQFSNNQSILLTDAIESKEDIDINRAKAAYDRAKDRLEHKNPNTDLKRAQVALEKAINRMNVYGGLH